VELLGESGFVGEVGLFGKLGGLAAAAPSSSFTSCVLSTEQTKKVRADVEKSMI
jgi:hypothetical protein